MRKMLFWLLALIFIMLLGGCTSIIVDNDNKNILWEEHSPSAPTVNVYYDTTNNMVKYLTSDMYSRVVYSAYSAISDTWPGTEPNIFSVNETVSELDNVFFSSRYMNRLSYGGQGSVIQEACRAITQLDDDKYHLNIIITDLSAQLNDFNAVANALISTALSNDKGMAVVGIDTQPEPFYMFVIGNKQHVSDYIRFFKNKPDVRQYELEQISIINYLILANESGIMGIDYSKIDFIEGAGDFRRVIEVGVEQMNSFERGGIEGTVNFNPTTNIIQTGDGIRNLGAMSLLRTRDINQSYSGKIKLEIPFKIIESVRLSTLDCIVTSELYLPDPADRRLLSKYEGDFREFIETSAAVSHQGEWQRVYSVDAEGNEVSFLRFVPNNEDWQGDLRVDDETNSLIFNVTLPNAALLPNNATVAKLNITIEHFSSIETLPLWIKEWDTAKSRNLVNMFSIIYNYQHRFNVAVNSFTLYIGIRN